MVPKTKYQSRIVANPLAQAPFTLREVFEHEPDPRLQRVHYDWLEAGEATLRATASCHPWKQP